MKSDGTLKERFNKEVLKWKELDKKQKWEYYKSYYLGKTIVGVLLFAMFCSLIYEIFINNKEDIIAGSIVNLKISEEGYSLLTDKYLEYYNISYQYMTTVMDRIKERFSKDELNLLEHVLEVMHSELMPEIELRNQPEEFNSET